MLRQHLPIYHLSRLIKIVMPVYPAFLLSALLIALPVSAYAVNDNQLDVNIAVNGFDAGGNDSLSSSRALNL